MTPETRAWLILLALSATSTALAVAGPSLNGWAIPTAAVALLTLAWAKVRVILTDYLGLRAAPVWLRGFSLVIGLYTALLLVLVLAGR
ncbi:MAG: cytochrome C oxidase subunit IV family protein [Pseudorhodobacter sp.]|nr:cytochrome C oxidase subunit IV family protein [Pseudorhodobacter sp.]